MVELQYFLENGNIELKNNKFSFIRVTGHPSQFSKLKQMCKNDITITFETYSIDDYWCIKLYDCLKDKEVVVPNFDYIVKIYDEGFTLVKSSDFLEYFNIIAETND